MKFYKLPVEIASRRDLSPAPKIIAAVLIDRLGQNDSCWPGIRSLARDSGLSVSGVLKALNKLQAREIFKVERQGAGKANRYRLNKPSVLQSTVLDKVERSTKCNRRVLQSAAQAPHKVQHNQTDQLNQTNILRPNSDEFRLSELLLNLILERKPDFKKPHLQSWSKHIDRMIRLDKRTPERIEAVIRWSQKDPFWQNNILSAEKLREKFDQLELKMNYGRSRISENHEQSEKTATARRSTSASRRSLTDVPESAYGITVET